MPSRSPQRNEIVASLRDRHDAQLRRVVTHRATTDPAIIDQACQNAWAQLVDAHDIELRPPRWSALAWVTTCAIRQAHAHAHEPVDLHGGSSSDGVGVGKYYGATQSLPPPVPLDEPAAEG